MTHTPGPWEIDFETMEGGIEIYPVKNGPPKFGRWAEVATASDHYDEFEANARLIASAPELLELLNEARQDLVDYWVAVTDKGQDNKDDLIARIDAAIAKAEGK